MREYVVVIIKKIIHCIIDNFLRLYIRIVWGQNIFKVMINTVDQTHSNLEVHGSIKILVLTLV